MDKDSYTDSPLGEGGGGSGGHHLDGQGRGGNHPQSHLQQPGSGRRGVSFEVAAEYDLADDYYGGKQYHSRNAISKSEYEARRASIFNPDNTAPMNNAVRGAMPPPSNAWQGQQGAGLYPTMNMLVPQGQQGQSIPPQGRGI